MKRDLGTFAGKAIVDMSREELLDVVEFLGRQYLRDHSPSRQRAYVLGRTEMMKRGEVYAEG